MHFPPSALVEDTSRWLVEDDPEVVADRKSLMEGLLFPDLMTRAIEDLYGVRATVDLAFAGDTPYESTYLQRQIILRAGEGICLLATSLIPKSLIEKYDWLRYLGTSALGETIERHVGVQRTEFLLHHAASGSILARNFSAQESTWARRYAFEIDGEQVLVAELFNPRFLRELSDFLHR